MILRELIANLLSLRLLPDEACENQRQIDRSGRQQRIGEIDQQPLLAVEVPGRSDQKRGEQGADGDQRDWSEIRREDDDQKPENQRGEKFNAGRVIRLSQHGCE